MNIINLIKQKAVIFILIFIVLFLAVIKSAVQEKKPIFPSPSPSVQKPSLKPKTVPSTTPFSKLKETEMAGQETQETLKLYPLIEYLPIDNQNYHLTYSAPFELKATIKQGSQEQIREQIIAWIISKNIDPSSQQIIFD